MGKTPKHFPSLSDQVLHKSVPGNTEGGRCLTGHSSSYDDETSCTYRWQAVRESRRSRTDIYNKRVRWNHIKDKILGSREEKLLPGGTKLSVPERHLQTSAYVSKQGKKNPAHYAFAIPYPRPGDWDIEGPQRGNVRAANGELIPRGKNFTRDTWPYWNNAHHLIPKEALNAKITRKISDATCRDLVRAALLRADYNINHYKNVILLPMDKEVGMVLNLPRHLTLEDGASALDPKPKFDHIAYTLKLQRRLDSIIDGFKQTTQEALESAKCDPWPQVTLSKEQLEKLSADLYKAVVDLGTSSPGASLADISL